MSEGWDYLGREGWDGISDEEPRAWPNNDG